MHLFQDKNEQFEKNLCSALEEHNSDDISF